MILYRDKTKGVDKKPLLMLLFTRGVSMRVWDAIGSLEREVEPYRRLAQELAGVSFLTYGGKSELEYAKKLGNIDIITNERGFSPTRFGILAPFLLHKAFRRVDVIKTNQIDGALTGVIAKLVFGKKLIVRCGYLMFFSYQKRYGSGWRTFKARLTEKVSFKCADVCMVSSPSHKLYLERIHKIPGKKIRVVPNSINTEIFRPMPQVEREKGLICFVGRLTPEKNLEALFDAVAGLPDVRLLVIGNGPSKEILEKRAADKCLHVEFHSRIPNYELPRYMNRAQVFVQPSFYEGCPKTLLEAMACELPVIGTDVEGIRDIIRHGQNGILCDKSPDSIRAAISSVLEGRADVRKMAKNARQYVLEHHSLDRIVQMELEIIRALCEG